MTGIWGKNSKEDIKTSQFLDLLLKYRYVWRQNNEEMKLNLTECEKIRFLEECRVLIEDIDELTASIKIELIRRVYTEEYSRLQKSCEVSEPWLPPWFFKAHKLFQQASMSESTRTSSSMTVSASDSLTFNASRFVTVSTANTSISSPCTPVIAIATDNPCISDPPLQITDASMSATVSALPSMSIVKLFPWTDLLPNWKLPPLDPNLKQPTNSYTTSPSVRNIYHGESSLRNMEPQYDIPVKYPVCILSGASLGESTDELDIPHSRYEIGSLSKNEIPVTPPMSFRPQISDFSFMSSNSEISNPPNDYKISYQSETALDAKCEEFAGKYPSHQSFQPTTSRAFIYSVVSSKSPTSPSTGAKFSTLNHTRDKFSTSHAGTKSSTLLADRGSLLPSSRASISSFTRSSISAFASDSSPVVSRVSIRQVNRDSTPLVSRDYTPLVSRESSLPVSKDSINRAINRSHQMQVGSALPSAFKVVSKGATSVMADVPNKPPTDVPSLPITDIPTLVTASSLPSASIVQPFSQTSLLPHCKLPSLDQNLKQSTNSSVTSPSVRNLYHSESSLSNVRHQYDFPVKYPICILSHASLGESKDGSGIPCSEYEIGTLSGNEMSVTQSASSRPQTSDFSFLK